MSENLRIYRRELALYALAKSIEPLMASELVELMRSLSESEAHPEHCMKALDTLTVSGVLKRLENEALAEQSGTKRDRRAGADRPAWRYSLGRAAAQKVSMPDPPPPPSTTQMLPPPLPRTEPTLAQEWDESRYDNLTRSQLYALLEVGDMALMELARLQQESLLSLQRAAALTGRIRTRLVEAGLGGRLP
jgi:hypothetical protein